MRETRGDTVLAVALALVLHALLFVLLLAGLWWTRAATPLSAAGSPVSAELIDASELSLAMQRTLERRPDPVKPLPPPPEPLPPPVEEDTTPPPQPLPEPIPEDAPVPPQPQAQAVIPEPAAIEQEQVDRNAISAETREREQEEQRRQEQIDLTERLKQEEAEKKQRLADQQRDDELKKIQAERAKIRREADLAEQKLKQIADIRAGQASRQAAASVSPPPGNEGADAGLAARYAAAIQEAVVRNWRRPDNVPIGQRCRITIRQLPGGEVIDALVADSCPFDAAGRRSVEAAVLRAQPLPYAGFETVFNRTLLLNFEAQDR
ncbi:MAG: cell envelope integrity protein TolA [Luteimonas sp.]